MGRNDTFGVIRFARPQLSVGQQGFVHKMETDKLGTEVLSARGSDEPLIMRIVNNRETAEELTLDVFHDVWRRASTYDPANGSVVGWVMNQARSRAIDRYECVLLTSTRDAIL